MFEFQSALFQNDPLLQAIADDARTPDGGLTRISRGQNPTDPAVEKVQLALLDWRPGCLPEHRADGEYGGECETAVHAFKLEELGVPEDEIIDDVGPLTVQRLDAIRAAVEAPAGNAVVTVVNQYGEPLAGVGITANDGSAESFASSDEAGQARLAIGAAAEVSLDEPSLLGALGDLLDRPAGGIDPGTATVVVPNGAVPGMLEPDGQLDLVVAARIDLDAKLLAPLEGSPRVEGPGLRLGFDGESAFLSLQAAGGAVAAVELDPPPSEIAAPEIPVIPAELLALPAEAVPGWVATAAEPLPDPPLPQAWFTVSADEILAVLYLDADPAPYHELVDRLQAPPAAGEDPASVAAARAEAIAAFLALGPEGLFGEQSPIESDQRVDLDEQGEEPDAIPG